MIPVTITSDSINLFLDGRMRTISKTHLNYDAVRRELQLINASDEAGFHPGHDLSHLRELVDIPSFIARITEGRVKIGDAGVMFDGEPVKGVIADRLVDMLQQGFNVRPLARFLERLMKNPTNTAIDEMYKWLESGNLPICEDGCFLAFKVVEEDFASGHRAPDGSKVYNRPGEIVEMPREQVDPSRHATCSSGLHFCSWQYLPHFGYTSTGSRVVVLKIAPEDVVAIPYDYNNSKGRAWRYLVLSEVPAEECEHLFDRTPIVSSFGCYDAGDDSEVEADEDDDTDENDPWYEEDCDDICSCCDTDIDDDDEDEISLDHDGPCGDGCDGTELTFRHGGRVFNAAEIKQMVADYGQRGTTRLTGIPRSTLQGWLTRVE